MASCSFWDLGFRAKGLIRLELGVSGQVVSRPWGLLVPRCLAARVQA